MLIHDLVKCYIFLTAWSFIRLSSLTLFKYALLMNPLARSIEELLPVGVAGSIWCFILLRTALVASSVCVAFLLPFFGICPGLPL